MLNKSFLSSGLITLAVVFGMNYLDVALTGVLLLAWVVLAIWPVLKHGLPRWSGSLSVWAFAWLAVLAFQIVHSQIPYVSWYYFWILAGLPIGILAWQLEGDPDQVWNRLRQALWIGAGLYALWGVIQVVQGGTDRAHGPLIDPNGYAAGLNLFWFALSARFLTLDIRSLHRGMATVMVFTLTLIAMAFFAAASRGATLSWLLCFPVLAWLVMRRVSDARRKSLILAATVVVGFGLIQVVSNNIFVQHADQAISGTDASPGIRLLIWKATLLMIHEHPFLGTGLGTWSQFYAHVRPDAEWSTTGFYAHNDYLQLAAEGGVFMPLILVAGLLIMASVLWRLGRDAQNRMDQVEAAGLLVAVMAVSLHAFVNFIFYYAFINILAGVFAGRAWQTWKGESHVRIWSGNAVSPELGRLMMGVLILFAGGSLVLHQVAGFLNCNHPVVTALEKVFPSIDEFKLAKAIHLISPNEPIPQNIILRGMDQTVENAASFGKPVQSEVLKETLEVYDDFSRHSTIRSKMLADEANLLVKYRELLPEGEAIKRAQKIALRSLKLDPRHGESIVALANTEFASGRKQAGLAILASGLKHIFLVRDQRLLELVYVKESIAPVEIPELDDYEKELLKISQYDYGKDEAKNLTLFQRISDRLKEIKKEYPNRF